MGFKKASRIALLHSLANIEQWAIDLSWDIISRFCSIKYPDGSKLPRKFYDDFIQVACDEAKVSEAFFKKSKSINFDDKFSFFFKKAF